MITTGHTHSYARTHLMSNYTQKIIASTSDKLQMKRGLSFATVVGTGGYDLSDFDEHTVPSAPYWAEVAASSSGLSYGATLCTFKAGNLGKTETPGNESHGGVYEAHCKFKDIKGRVWDEYTIKSDLISIYDETDSENKP